ncbi:Mediator of RNA polymerase II transcription subunit 6 [Gaertneriomyces sp. JEL0708]|nr:Mediator of RNA polymerase II transcription subunit 6 [Gaertneriomyces sp. JEL0708]
MAQTAYQDLTHVSWKDTGFLQMFGLNEQNIMDYFARSPFYDLSCINEQLRMQSMHNQHLSAEQLDKRQMTGIDYELLYAIPQSGLFVITVGNRRSPTQVDTIGAYYVIEGTVYQSPDLYTLLSNRIYTSLHHVESAFQEVQSQATYHPAMGNYWKADERLVKKARKDARDMLKSRDGENNTTPDARGNKGRLLTGGTPLEMQRAHAFAAGLHHMIQQSAESMLASLKNGPDPPGKSASGA